MIAPSAGAVCKVAAAAAPPFTPPPKKRVRFNDGDVASAAAVAAVLATDRKDVTAVTAPPACVSGGVVNRNLWKQTKDVVSRPAPKEKLTAAASGVGAPVMAYLVDPVQLAVLTGTALSKEALRVGSCDVVAADMLHRVSAPILSTLTPDTALPVMVLELSHIIPEVALKSVQARCVLWTMLRKGFCRGQACSREDFVYAYKAVIMDAAFNVGAHVAFANVKRALSSENTLEDCVARMRSTLALMTVAAAGPEDVEEYKPSWPSIGIMPHSDGAERDASALRQSLFASCVDCHSQLVAVVHEQLLKLAVQVSPALFSVLLRGCVSETAAKRWMDKYCHDVKLSFTPGVAASVVPETLTDLTWKGGLQLRALHGLARCETGVPKLIAVVAAFIAAYPAAWLTSKLAVVEPCTGTDEASDDIERYFVARCFIAYVAKYMLAFVASS